MRRASWLLGSFALCTIAACGGGNRQDTTGGAGSETGTMSGDTASMAPSATPTDTAMTAPGAAGTDTAGDTTQAK
jgi:hypothetical protein